MMPERDGVEHVMDIVEIVEAAKGHAVRIFADDAGSEPRLEEIIPVNGSIWDVTLSFRRKAPLAAGGLAINLAPHLVNYHKVIRVDGSNGELVQIQDVDHGA
jgi:hypothetical protein